VKKSNFCQSLSHFAKHSLTFIHKFLWTSFTFKAIFVDKKSVECEKFIRPRFGIKMQSRQQKSSATSIPKMHQIWSLYKLDGLNTNAQLAKFLLADSETWEILIKIHNLLVNFLDIQVNHKFLLFIQSGVDEIVISIPLTVAPSQVAIEFVKHLADNELLTLLSKKVKVDFYKPVIPRSEKPKL
jgi:hypothetical protein